MLNSCTHKETISMLCNPLVRSVSAHRCIYHALCSIRLTLACWILCRLTNGASFSKQDQAELQRIKSSLLQLPSRKRSRSSLGVDRGLERDSSPSTSTAARSQDRAYRHTTSAHEGGATSKPDKPDKYAFHA